MQRDAKLLLFTGGLKSGAVSGREKLCQLNHDVLLRLLGDAVVVFKDFQRVDNLLSRSVLAAAGYLDGLSPTQVERVFRIVYDEGISTIFIDGSNYGVLAQKLKTKRPELEIITFFHNVEVRFFIGALRHKPGPKSLLIALANYYAEKNAVKFSDKIVCLNKRDSDLLRKVYGRAADFIAPMALKEPDELATKARASPDRDYCLFVGGAFYANMSGLQWFIERVLPRIDLKLYVIGRGMQNHRSDFEKHDRVALLGEVESTSGWYESAMFVVCLYSTGLE